LRKVGRGIGCVVHRVLVYSINVYLEGVATARRHQVIPIIGGDYGPGLVNHQPAARIKQRHAYDPRGVDAAQKLTVVTIAVLRQDELEVWQRRGLYPRFQSIVSGTEIDGCRISQTNVMPSAAIEAGAATIPAATSHGAIDGSVDAVTGRVIRAQRRPVRQVPHAFVVGVPNAALI